MATFPAGAETTVTEPALTVAAVARALGVAPATLRTWDRRYGLGPSAHTAGSHRRYTTADVTRLHLMRSLTLEGVTPSDAARLALEQATDQQPPEHASRHAALATVSRLPDSTPGIATGVSAGNPGGGRVIALPGSTPEARGLARAATALDANACTAIITAALNRDGVVGTWDSLLVPVLVAVGERWARTGEGVETEHLLAETVVGCLRRRAGALTSARNGRPVLLASAPEDQHSLPLYAIAAALADIGIASRVLGARMPVEATRAAVERTGPPAVLVWSQMPATGDPRVLEEIPVQRPAPLIVAAGPGWLDADLPSDVPHAKAFQEALQLLEGAVTGHRR